MTGRQRGFTLIELLIVVAIIAIIVAIVIPNLLRSRISANETNAAGAMRVISTAEAGFQSAAFVDNDGDGAGDYGTLLQLANPDGAGLTPGFIDSVLGSGVKHGYNFSVTVTLGSPAARPTYTCISWPSTPGRSGLRQFFVDDTGVIRYTSDGTVATPGSPPLT